MAFRSFTCSLKSTCGTEQVEWFTEVGRDGDRKVLESEKLKNELCKEIRNYLDNDAERKTLVLRSM